CGGCVVKEGWEGGWVEMEGEGAKNFGDAVFHTAVLIDEIFMQVVSLGRWRPSPAQTRRFQRQAASGRAESAYKNAPADCFPTASIPQLPNLLEASSAKPDKVSLLLLAAHRPRSA